MKRKKYIKPEVEVIPTKGDVLMSVLSAPGLIDGSQEIDPGEIYAKDNKWGYHNYNDDFHNYDPWEDTGTDEMKSPW